MLAGGSSCEKRGRGKRRCGSGSSWPWPVLPPAVLSHSQAGDYPSRPIVWIAPSAGASSDIGARTIAPALAEWLGQPVVVENKPGAGGIISVQAAAAAKPDGYTILYASSGAMATYPHTYRKLTYDPATSFTPVHGIAAGPLVLVVNAGSPHRSLADLVAAARAAPGRLNYGSIGIGSAQHLTMMLLMQDAGIAMTHIPYRSTPAVLADLLGGSIDLMFDLANVLGPQIEAGRVRALAVSGAARLVALPAVPTFVEAGYADVVFTAWGVAMAPAGTPPAVVERLSAAFDHALRDPRVVAYHRNTGAIALTDMGPAQTAAFIAAESARIKILVEKAGIVPE